MPEILQPLKIIDGIKCYTADIADDHEDYHAAGLDNIYKQEKQHFWFISRREKIIKYFKKFTDKNASILEIGAGTAYVALGLQQAKYKVSVGELHLSGLYYAKQQGIKDCLQFDLYNPPHIDEYDAIGMFDVLEHLSDADHALKKINSMLKNNGKLYITVPAHQWLWSREDEVAAHKTRYTKKSLTDCVTQSGFKVLKVDYFFTLILPLLWLRKILNPATGKAINLEEHTSSNGIPKLINTMLLLICRVENKISSLLPNIFGGSIIMVAEKNSKGQLKDG